MISLKNLAYTMHPYSYTPSALLFLCPCSSSTVVVTAIISPYSNNCTHDNLLTSKVVYFGSSKRPLLGYLRVPMDSSVDSETREEGLQEANPVLGSEGVEEPYILTVRIIKATGLLRQKEGLSWDAKRAKLGSRGGKKGKPDKGKKPGKGGADEEGAPEPLNSAVSFLPFHDGSAVFYPAPEIAQEGEEEEPKAVMSEIVNDSTDPEYNFEKQFHITNRRLFLDTACSTPLAVQVLQCFGKKEPEKGAKNAEPEEKTQSIGSASVSLAEFCEGAVTIEQTLTLEIDEEGWENAAAAHLGEAFEEAEMTEEEQDKKILETVEVLKGSSNSQVHLIVSLDRPIVNNEEIRNSNMVKFEIKGIYSMPAIWAESLVEKEDNKDGKKKGPGPEEPEFTDSFSVMYTMPLFRDEGRRIETRSSLVRVDHGAPNAEPPVAVPEPASAEVVEGAGEVGEATNLGNGTQEGESDETCGTGISNDLRACVEYDYCRPSYLPKEAVAQLKESIERGEPFLLRINASRTPTDDRDAHHNCVCMGEARVNLRGLVRPGSTEIEMAVPVTTVEPPPPTAEELDAKAVAAKGKKGKAGKGKQDVEAREAVPWEETETFVRVKVSLRAPLFPRRAKLKLDDVVRSNAPVPSPRIEKTPAVKEAEHTFIEKVKTAAGVLEEHLPKTTPSNQNPIVTEILANLTRKGISQSIISSLKPALVDIIQNQFHQKLPGAKDSTSSAKAQFNELYASLSRLLAQSLNLEESPDTLDEEDVEVDAQLLAHSSELGGDVELAARHHQNMIASNGVSAQTWYEYGSFYLRQYNMEHAEACFTKAVEMEPDHLPTLIVFGCLLCDQKRLDQAAPLLRHARELEPSHVVVLGLLGLFHELAEEDEQAWKLYDQAKNLLTQKNSGDATRDDDLLDEIFGPAGLSVGSQPFCSLGMYETWAPLPTDTPCPEGPDCPGYDDGDNPWQEALYLCLSRFLLATNLPLLAERLVARSRSRTPGSIASDRASRRYVAADYTARALHPSSIDVEIQGVSTDPGAYNPALVNPAAIPDAGQPGDALGVGGIRVDSVGGKDMYKFARLFILAEIYASTRKTDEALVCLQKAEEALSTSSLLPSKAAHLHMLAVKGHTFYRKGDEEQARVNYCNYISQFYESGEGSILDPLASLQLVRILAMDEDQKAATKAFEYAWQMAADPIHSRSAYSWIALGAAALRDDQHELAEQALAVHTRTRGHDFGRQCQLIK